MKYAKNAIRWGIAVVGILWVVTHMAWHDHVLAILPGDSVPTKNVQLTTDNATENDLLYSVYDPRSGKTIELSRDQVVNEPDRKNYTTFSDPDNKLQLVVGVDLDSTMTRARRVLLADDASSKTAHWVNVSDVPHYEVSVPHPRVQIGVPRMFRQASNHLGYLLGAIAIFPITIIICSFRWHELLKALDIHLKLSRVFELTMVGLFFNTFLLGSTGGDLIKALYVQRQTHHRTRAVMSVLVDRAIGLLALIMLGGGMAALQWKIPTCRRVAMASAGLVGITLLGMIVFYIPTLRKATGLAFIIDRLSQKSRKVSAAVHTMELYGHRKLLGIGSLLVSFPVHIVVIIAAWLCGLAFGLHVATFYYWMAVPVIVLSGALPISPQGAGVMELFAIKLLEPQGVTVAQAFALTMSIRLIPIFWNLCGFYFVFTGKYHAPTQSEQEQAEAEADDDVEAGPAAAAQSARG